MISFSLVRIYGTSNVLGREDIQSAEIFTSALKMSGSLLLTLNKGTANKHQNEKKKCKYNFRLVLYMSNFKEYLRGRHLLSMLL